MNINEHIDYWVETSNDDYEVSLLLFESKKYLHSLFLAHLSIEKLIKAHWVKDNNNAVPPKIHNLLTLLKQTKLQLNYEQTVFLPILNDFQIQGRYPDYKQKINQYLTKEYAFEIIERYKELRKCLLANIA